MSGLPPPDGLEDLQRRLRELLQRNPLLAKLAAEEPPTGPGSGRPGGDPPSGEDAPGEAALRRVRQFNLRPREVRDHLDRFVIRQTEAKKVLSVALCDHYNHVRRCLEDPALRERDYAKPNVLLLGPTGVGKTYLIRCAARLVGVPFVKADATKFSETGYVGGDVEDLVRDLVKAADGDVELAQYGIVYLDEVDKIAAQPTATGRDVSGRGVQTNLLKLLEDTEVSLHSQTDLLGQMQAMMDFQRTGRARPRKIRTGHILFIASGAFDKLGEAVRRRVASGRIGFGPSRGSGAAEDTDWLREAQTQDFVQYGFEPEFIGRLPVRVACHALSALDLEQVLAGAEGSILQQFTADFAGYGIELRVTPEAVRAIAAQAHAEGTGARGLLTVLERVLRDFKFELPSTRLRRLDVTAETVAQPGEALAALLEEARAGHLEVARAEVLAFAERFRAAHGFELEFTAEAVAALAAEAQRREKTLRGLCEEKFRDYEHGLKLATRDGRRRPFTISAAVVAEPQQQLSRWVVEAFRAATPEEGTGHA